MQRDAPQYGPRGLGGAAHELALFRVQVRGQSPEAIPERLRRAAVHQLVEEIEHQRARQVWQCYGAHVHTMPPPRETHVERR